MRSELDERQVTSFRGIPCAKPTSGRRRHNARGQARNFPSPHITQILSPIQPLAGFAPAWDMCGEWDPSRLEIIIPMPDLSVTLHRARLPLLRNLDVFSDFVRQLDQIQISDAP